MGYSCCKEFLSYIDKLEKRNIREGCSYYTGVVSFIASICHKNSIQLLNKYDIITDYKLELKKPRRNLKIDIYSQLFIIEFKHRKSKEFKVKENGEKIILTSRGKLNLEEFEKGKVNYPNQPQDGIGQIRGYYYYLKKEGKLEENALSILTNGKIWLFFEFKTKSNGTMNSEIRKDDVLLAVDISEKEDCILLSKFLRDFINKENNQEVSLTSISEKYSSKSKKNNRITLILLGNLKQRSI